jgi:serine/threonine protein kinase
MDHHNLCYGCMENKCTSKICTHCGYDQTSGPASSHHLAPGKILHDKYLIGKVLGQGGFGITYLAWDVNLELKIAVKEFFPMGLVARSAGSTRVETYAVDQDEQFSFGIDRFLGEAKTLARFSEHPNIVTVRDFFKANNTAYMVMNYVEGVTLESYLKKAGEKIAFPAMLKIMMPVMDALQEIHRSGVMHRDISPDNIFIRNDGRVILVDFGAARQELREKSKSLSVIIKAGYAPEEQYRTRGRQGPWTDIYAVAATMYRCITGKVPFEAIDRLDEDDLVPPSQLGVVIEPKQEQALLKALAIKARNRYQAVEEFQSEMVAASDKGLPGEKPVGAGPKKPAELVRPEVKAGEEGLKEKEQAGVQDEVVIEPQKKPEPAKKLQCRAKKDAVWNKINKKTVKAAALVLLCGLLIFGALSLFGEEGGFGLTWQRKYTYDDGSKYTGQLKNGLPHGEGTRIWASGTIYVGEFKDSQRHGQGKLTLAAGGEYLGEFEDDRMHGQGTLTLADGYKYVGEFEDDKKHGQGTLTLSDGSEYVGEFKDGLFHGQGTLTLANGYKYVGEFEDDRPHGQGTYTGPSGQKYISE